MRAPPFAYSQIYMLDFFDLLRTEPTLLMTTASLFGLLMGSFLNVVIHRIPRMMELEWKRNCAELHGQEPEETPTFTLVRPGSTCPTCGHAIRAWENIPLLSYLLLGGKCAACKSRISPRYPLVEAVAGLLAGLIAWHFGFSLATLAAMAFTFSLLALTFIDADTHLLPDDITLPLLWLGLLFNLGQGFADLPSAVIGAIAGYLTLWSIYWLFKLVTGKEGMGYGDFKLLAAIGAWFGWQLLPAVLLLASVVGSIIGIAMILLARHGRNTPIPFGPYLALGGIAALFWGERLSSLYLPPGL